MPGTYTYLYQLDSESNVIGELYRSFDGPFAIDDSMDLHQITIVDMAGAGFPVDAGFYQGTDSDNNVFLTLRADGSGEVYYLTNTRYDNEQPVSTSFSNRIVNDYVACFLIGTSILTPSGPKPVEQLSIGELLCTASGREAVVKWIGRQTVGSVFDRSEQRAPIIIEAGALGENLPHRELRLTADHALLLDGVLVQAGALVNGVSIRRMSRAETGERYTVWHIETEGHDVIVAEGCAAETFVDNVSRRRFDNFAEYQAMFGDEGAAIRELDLPRIKSARQLPQSLRNLIAVRQAA